LEWGTKEKRFLRRYYQLGGTRKKIKKTPKRKEKKGKSRGKGRKG